MTTSSYDINIPIGALIEHLNAGLRLYVEAMPSGYPSNLAVSLEHLAPFGQFFNPRPSPADCARNEKTFLLRVEGKKEHCVFYTAASAVWAFLQAIEGYGAVRVVEVATLETDRLTKDAISRNLLSGHRERGFFREK